MNSYAKKTPSTLPKRKASRRKNDGRQVNSLRNRASFGQRLIAVLTIQLIFIASAPFRTNAQGGGRGDRKKNGNCKILALLPFELDDPNSKQQTSKQLPKNFALGQMASALMAKEHFNSKNAYIIGELNKKMYEACQVDVVFKDVPDSVTKAASSIQEAYDALKDVDEKFCAVVGPYSEKSILSSSILTAGRGIPILSYHASTYEIGNPVLRQLSASTIPRVHENVIQLLDYIINARKRNYIALLYYGSELSYLNGAFDDAINLMSEEYDGEIEFVSIAIASPLKKSYERAVKIIKDMGFKTIIVALSRANQWDELYITADKYDMTSKDSNYVWLSYDTVDMEIWSRPMDNDWKKAKRRMWQSNNYTESDKKRHMLARAKLLNGAGYFRVLDGFEEYEDLGKDVGQTRYTGEGYRFLESWKEMNKTLVKEYAEDLAVGQKKWPFGDYFEQENLAISRYAGYLYDAVMALGLGKCRASLAEFENFATCHRQCPSKWTGPPQYPNTNSRDLFFNLLGRNLTFGGVTGDVVLNNERYFSRSSSTVSYGIYNIRIKDRTSMLESLYAEDMDDTEKYEFEYVLTSVKRPFEEDWTTPLNNEKAAFIFADNTTDEPMPLNDLPEEEKPTWFITTIASVSSVAFILFLLIIGGAVYIRYRKADDSVWTVEKSELKFSKPPEIIGRGTFGLVVLAEYRGTEVAIKKVIPPRSFDIVEESLPESTMHSMEVPSGIATEDDWGTKSGVSVDQLISSINGLKSGNGISLTTASTNAGNISGSSQVSFLSGKGSSLVGKAKSEYDQLKKDFILEMRHLSKLRHPCITTVMGAVIGKKDEPLLVMEYMLNGSLYDLLHNETVIVDGDLILPILCDISQGLRFLHAATPKVIHGDLKAKNVLVDSKFRAKVSDFGLSQKRRVGATGTPYWMAPELLRGEATNSPETDVYSFGMILYEVYSRKDPYEGEDYRYVIQAIVDPDVNKRPQLPPSCPPEVRSLFKDCLLDKPEDRPKTEEVDVRLRRMDVDTAGPGQILFSKQMKKEDRLTQRTKELLFDVFPPSVAEALRDGKKVDPQSVDVVTIFFSDIVGFTKISSTLSPIKISEMLDRLYNRFDYFSREHDVFKVETIGDAYMAVTNLVKDQSHDHAKRIAEFSIEAMKAANETIIDVDDESKGYVNIRVGFHSGPVVANVVGSRNPRYCLFGDTVNTASRMESNSEMNRIHCSEKAANFVKAQSPEMRVKSRGKIPVKGKGEMHTYWVTAGTATDKVVEKVPEKIVASVPAKVPKKVIAKVPDKVTVKSTGNNESFESSDEEDFMC